MGFLQITSVLPRSKVLASPGQLTTIVRTYCNININWNKTLMIYSKHWQQQAWHTSNKFVEWDYYRICIGLISHILTGQLQRGRDILLNKQSMDHVLWPINKLMRPSLLFNFNTIFFLIFLVKTWIIFVYIPYKHNWYWTLIDPGISTLVFLPLAFLHSTPVGGAIIREGEGMWIHVV